MVSRGPAAFGPFPAFADWVRPATRLSDLMGLPVICGMRHDSIGRGEDGPTHQPIEYPAIRSATPDAQEPGPADDAGGGRVPGTGAAPSCFLPFLQGDRSIDPWDQTPGGPRGAGATGQPSIWAPMMAMAC